MPIWAAIVCRMLQALELPASLASLPLRFTSPYFVMAQSLRLSGSLLARVSSRSLPATRRSFAVSTVARADLIQDLYLKEIKAYKVPTPKASDAEGQVAKFSPPAVPKSPEEANLASEMKEYEDQVVEVEGQAATGETQAIQEDYFEDLKQFDDEPAHH